jgi:hypothetical protein
MKDTIAERLSSARRKLSELSQPTPPRIAVEQLAKELDLENEARRLAAAGLPSPDETTLSAVEARTVQRVETARHECVKWASGRLRALQESSARQDVSLLVNEALAADKNFERHAAATIAEHEHLVEELAHQAEIRERELADFRARNHITRPATYPEGGATFARYAVLLALIVVEGVANAYFFSQGLESGLVGGFFAAGLFAAVNLVTAFVLGKYAVPLVFHQNRLVTAFGVLSAGFAVVCMIAIALTIAHFRDALIADAAEPARAAWLALKSAPYGLRDVMSWLLFAISMLFAVFALFDGLSSDDFYPGYGRVARRAQQSRNDYLGELQAIRATLESIKNDELMRIERNMQKARALVTEAAGTLRDKKWLRTQVEAALLDAESCLATLLKVFRVENELHRGSLPNPPYFDSRPALQKLPMPDFGTEDDRARLDVQERTAEQLLAQADQVRARIEAQFAAHSDRLKPQERRPWTVATHPKLVGSAVRQR